MKTIIKRDDTTEIFDINKIAKVLKIAFNNTNVVDPDITSLLDYINKELDKKNADNYNIEEIQDLVENSLMIFK
jgi:ribonucleoside-diphosphate reductase alpha chain